MATKKPSAKANGKSTPKTPAKTASKAVAKTVQAKKPSSKKVPGRSSVTEDMPLYKPSIYLDNGQIPKELKGAKVGDKVTLQVTGKIIRKTESADTNGVSNTVGIEMGSIAAGGKATKKGRGK